MLDGLMAANEQQVLLNILDAFINRIHKRQYWENSYEILFD